MSTALQNQIHKIPLAVAQYFPLLVSEIINVGPGKLDKQAMLDFNDIILSINITTWLSFGFVRTSQSRLPPSFEQFCCHARISSAPAGCGQSLTVIYIEPKKQQQQQQQQQTQKENNKHRTTVNGQLARIKHKNLYIHVLIPTFLCCDDIFNDCSCRVS